MSDIREGQGRTADAIHGANNADVVKPGYSEVEGYTKTVRYTQYSI